MPSTKELVKQIKQKKELSGIADKIIEEILDNYLNKYHLSLASLSQKQAKIIVKEIRSQLRDYTGQFQKSLKNRFKFLDNNQINELLKTHASTSERLDFYPSLRKIISSLKIKSILDIGCGLNPIALAPPKITYYASDIREDELSLIKKFFDLQKINGKTFVYDIRKFRNDLPYADLVIIFKVLDLIKEFRSLITSIINSLDCKYLLVSFSTKKLSGKPMNFPRRIWFEKILQINNLQFETFSSDNEIFYLIKKSKFAS